MPLQSEGQDVDEELFTRFDGVDLKRSLQPETHARTVRIEPRHGDVVGQDRRNVEQLGSHRDVEFDGQHAVFGADLVFRQVAPQGKIEDQAPIAVFVKGPAKASVRVAWVCASAPAVVVRMRAHAKTAGRTTCASHAATLLMNGARLTPKCPCSK